MKKLLLFIINFCFVAAMGQNLIAPITISLPANPPANTADWSTAMPPVMINAQTKMPNGQISPLVIESKILVTIKSGGSIICGSYNSQTAPQSNFNSATKTWSGAAVLSLLGKDCILKPGTYELCVQFYALNPAQGGLLGEACKSFIIAEAKQQSFSPPVNIVPEDGKILSKLDEKKPITFRWTPILPKPKDDIVYKVKIVEVLPGTSKAQAVKTNSPLFEKDVTNQTQLSCCGDGTSVIIWPFTGSNNYAWNVQAYINNKLIGESEASLLSTANEGKTENGSNAIIPITPTEAQPAKTARPEFQWKLETKIEGVTYTVVVREIETGKDPKTGKVVFTKEGIKENVLRYPADAPSLDTAKAYTWSVSAYDKNKSLVTAAGPIIISWPFLFCWPIAWPQIADVCLGSPMQIGYVVIGGSGPTSWTLSNGQSGTSNPITISPLPTTPGTYTYTGTIIRGSCPPSPISVTFNVYPNLSAGVLDYPNGNPISSLCYGEDATLKINGLPASCSVSWIYTVNGTGMWNAVPGGGIGNLYNTNQINWFPCTGNSVTLTFLGFVDPACFNLPSPWPAACPDRLTTSLTVWCPTVAGSIAASSSTHTIQPGNKICSNGNYPVNLSLTLSGNIGNITGWTRSPGSIPTSTNSTITDVITAAGTYVYTVNVQNGPAIGGCAAARAQITIIVEDPPSATLTTNTYRVCWGQAAQLTLSNVQPAGATIQWQYQINCTGPWTTTGVIGTVQNSNELFGPSYPGVFPPTSLPCNPNSICWRAVITSPTGICTPTTTNTITINITVPPTAPVISAGGPLVKCPGQPVALTASTPTCGTGPFTYQWYLNGLPVPGTQTIQAVNPGNYSVEVFNRDSCASAMASNIVTVRDCIMKVIVMGPCTCKEGTTVTLSANVSSTVDPPGPPMNCGGPYTYLWSTGATSQSITFQCPQQSITLWVEVTNAMGCKITVNHKIKKCN